MRILEAEEVALVSGGVVEIVQGESGGFWSEVGSTIAGWFSSGGETSIPANSAFLGIRG